MDLTRQNKVARLVQKELANIFQFASKDITMGRMITVTVVRVTPDLGIARVYLSIFPTNDSYEVMTKVGLHTANIRHQLAQKIRHQLKSIPELQFYIDDSLDYIDNIENLLLK